MAEISRHPDGWTEMPAGILGVAMRNIGSTHIQVFQRGPLRVILSKDAGRWHLSVSRSGHLPTWEEQKLVRYEILPDVGYMVQVLPPLSQYISLHPTTMHWWEVDPDPRWTHGT